FISAVIPRSFGIAQVGMAGGCPTQAHAETAGNPVSERVFDPLVQGLPGIPVFRCSVIHLYADDLVYSFQAVHTYFQISSGKGKPGASFVIPVNGRFQYRNLNAPV